MSRKPNWIVAARVEDGDSIFADDPITAPMLAEMARVYDPQVRMAPIISGYDPASGTSGPAHFVGEYTPPLGYVRGLDFDGVNLWADIDELLGADGQGLVSERVSQGFLQRSIAWWGAMPDFPGKRKPPYLRHIALLGGEPAGIPNLPPLTDYFVGTMGEQNGRMLSGMPYSVRHLVDLPRAAVPAAEPETQKEESNMTPEEIQALIARGIAEAIPSIVQQVAAPIGEAVRTAVEPLATQVNELRTTHNTNAAASFEAGVQARMASLVSSGRLTPAQRTAESEFLTGLPQEKVLQRLGQLEAGAATNLDPSRMARAFVAIPDASGANPVNLDLRRYSLPAGHDGAIQSANEADLAVVAEARRTAGGDPQKLRAALYAAAGEFLEN